MRQDMFKVIVERPRRGVGYYRTLPNEYRAAKHFKLDEDLEVNDEFVGRVPMRSKRLGYDGKSLNENLNPLKRFLKSRRGHVWNDVFSEVCENLDTSSTVKQHVRDHLLDYVEVNAWLGSDGEIYYNDRFHGTAHISRLYDFYVNPKDGTLRDATDQYGGWKDNWKKRQEEEAKKTWKTFRVIDGITFKKIKGTWFKITPIVKQIASECWDDNLKRYINSGNFREETIYQQWTVSKKEIRDYSLNSQ